MFTTSGIGVIPKDEIIEEKVFNNVYYFRFNLISKNPYKDQRNYVKVNISIPFDYIEQAREALQPGKALHIRIGELSGNKSDKGYVFMEVKTKWKWIEPIKALPTKERKEYKDV